MVGEEGDGDYLHPNKPVASGEEGRFGLIGAHRGHRCVRAGARVQGCGNPNRGGEGAAAGAGQQRGAGGGADKGLAEN